MQKRIIALAVFGLMSGAAFAQTSVTIGGKIDASYQLRRISNVDAQCGTTNNCGGTTTETLGDGAASTSRITIQAKEDLMPGWNAMVDLDLRFGNSMEGKNSSSSSLGGLNANDKKGLYLLTPYGNLRWGVLYLVNQQFFDFEEKPYMTNIKDTEIVKYGVSMKRMAVNTVSSGNNSLSTLTDRVTEFDSPVLNVGPVSTRVKFSYAIGGKRKSGESNNDSTPTTTTAPTVGGPTGSGDVFAGSWTGGVGKLVNWGISAGHRASTSDVAAARNGLLFKEVYVNVHPIQGLKIGLGYNIYKGYGDTNASAGYGAYKEKNTHVVVSYNFGDRFQIGFEKSRLNDLSQNRNSGSGWMLGASYHLSKTAYAYLARSKENFERNVKGSGSGNISYDGTKAGFIGNFDKIDNTYTKLGFVKEF